MNTALVLLISICALLASAAEKRGTEYYTRPQGQAYSYSHFSQDLPANEGLLRLLPSLREHQPHQHIAVVPVYLQQHVPLQHLPVQQVPVISRVPLVYPYMGTPGQAKPNTFPHLRPYYKQLDE